VKRVKKINGLLLLIPILALVFVSIPVPVKAPEVPTISLDPSGTVNVNPGDPFSVNLMISDVTDLGGYECKLSYDKTLLHVTLITIVTDWFGPTVKVWVKQNLPGLVRLVVTLPLGTVVGVDGSGVVATIDFMVDGSGMTPLDLKDTILADPWAVPFVHYAADGVFANVPLPQLWIKDKGAQGGGMWPEWHVAAPGTLQTLYARIVNLGDVGSYMRVEIAVYNPMAGRFILLTNAGWIPPKSPQETTLTVTADFTDTGTEGVYYVSGTVQFSLDGNLWANYAALEPVLGGRGTTRDVPGNDATKFKTH